MEPTLINFASKYSENSTEVKNFFLTLDKISSNFKLEKIEFLDSVDKYGNTLLHNIVIEKDLETLGSLLNLISNVNTKSKLLDCKNKQGNTAFHLAAEFCQTAKIGSPECLICTNMAKLLDNAGANKNIPNNKGEIISSDAPKCEQSEYKTNLLAASRKFVSNSLFGGISSLLANMTTEVSIDYKNSNKPVNNLHNLPTEVSVAERSSPVVTEQSAPSVTEQSVHSQTEQSATEQSVTATERSGNASTERSGTASTEKSGTDSVVSSKFNSSDSSNTNNMKGGANSEKSTMSNTSSFVKSLLTQFNSMKGGSSRSTGQRRLPSLNDYDYNEMYGGRDFSLSREQMKESSSLHDEVVKIFMDNGKNEEEARIMKMALYKYTKDKHPELNNLDRAKKMREYADESSIVNKLDLDTSRKIFEEVSKSKQKNSENSENSSKKNTEMNTSEIETTEEKPKKAKKASVKKASVKKASVKKAKK